jgi:hypothetical protein
VVVTDDHPEGLVYQEEFVSAEWGSGISRCWGTCARLCARLVSEA